MIKCEILSTCILWRSGTSWKFRTSSKALTVVSNTSANGGHSAQLWDAWGLSLDFNTTSLLCAAHWPPLSPEKDGTAESPGTLRDPDTCGGLWMPLWWGRGTAVVMNTQPFIGHPWHRSHSDRYPLRHKEPAASSGRLTHNSGQQRNTAPFRKHSSAPPPACRMDRREWPRLPNPVVHSNSNLCAN